MWNVIVFFCAYIIASIEYNACPLLRRNILEWLNAQIYEYKPFHAKHLIYLKMNQLRFAGFFWTRGRFLINKFNDVFFNLIVFETSYKRFWSFHFCRYDDFHFCRFFWEARLLIRWQLIIRHSHNLLIESSNTYSPGWKKII